MPKYSVKLARTLSSTASVGTITADGSAPRRFKVFRVELGLSGTPADTHNLWRLQRCTAAGTSTAVTPQALDAGDPAAINDAGENHTVEPTYTANAIVLDRALHTRSPYSLFLGPGYEFVCPGTAANGLGLHTPTVGSTIAGNATLHYEE
jgi:hypothetical protein